MDFINRIFRGDRVIWMIFMLLCLISIVEVYSASSTLAYRHNYWDPIMRHSIFLLAGLGVVLLVHSFKPKFLSVLALLLPLAWFLLVATKFFGSSVNGAERWLSIGGISFQPSELAKLFLIASTAFILSKRKNNPKEKDKGFTWILVLTGITCLIILLDNFSTATLLFGIVYILMFIGQIPLKKLALLTLVMLTGLILFVSFLLFVPSDTMSKVFPRGITWKERIKDFRSNGEEDIRDPKVAFSDDNLQVTHSKIAIASGKVFGNMPGNSQARDFLPQAYSDFIFAIIIEELGLIGGLVVILLYVILFIRTGIIAGRCEKMFPKYMAIGSALIIVTQAFTNMAVAVSLIPVTGQPLPLISRGGTSTLITCVYIGIILGVSRFENPKGVQREEAINLQSAEEALAAQERQKAFQEENINAGEF